MQTGEGPTITLSGLQVGSPAGSGCTGLAFDQLELDRGRGLAAAETNGAQV